MDGGETSGAEGSLIVRALAPVVSAATFSALPTELPFLNALPVIVVFFTLSKGSFT